MAEKFLIISLPRFPADRRQVLSLADKVEGTASFTRAAVVEGRFRGAAVQWTLCTFAKGPGTGDWNLDEVLSARDATLSSVIVTMADSLVFIEEYLLDLFQRMCPDGIQMDFHILPVT